DDLLHHGLRAPVFLAERTTAAKELLRRRAGRLRRAANIVPPRAGCVSAAETAEHLVVDQPRDRRPLAADDALGIAAELQDADLRPERLEVHHPADERRPLPEDQLDRLERLHAADDPR